MRFKRAITPQDKFVCNAFLTLHNDHGMGSTKAYLMYFMLHQNGMPIAVAKFAALHTPAAAKMFGGDDWKHVYVLQRLAAHNLPENTLSKFLSKCFKEMGKDPKVHYICTYADTGVFNQHGMPHNGGIYRACNATYFGMSKGGTIYGYINGDGNRKSIRKGNKTLRKNEIPTNAQILRSTPKHRYAWAVGPPLKRTRRRLLLIERSMKYGEFVPAYQMRLLAIIRKIRTYPTNIAILIIERRMQVAIKIHYQPTNKKRVWKNRAHQDSEHQYACSGLSSR